MIARLLLLCCIYYVVSPDSLLAAERCLAGTIWEGKDGPQGDCPRTRFEFHEDGTLVYSYNGNTYDNGTWKQTNDRIYFEMNDRYRESSGVISIDRIEIRSWNQANSKWNTKLQKRGKVKEKNGE